MKTRSETTRSGKPRPAGGARRSANPLRHQLPAYSPVELSGIVRASGSLLRGPRDHTSRLRGLLAEEYGARRVILTGSGTQALTLALTSALQWAGRGGEEAEAVALPAYSCYDVAAAALASGRPLRFYDLDPDTLGPDPESLEAVVAEGVGVVVVASLFGLPLPWDTLDPILGRSGRSGGEGERGILVIEDAAQGFGGRDDEGRPLGSRGDLGVLSFGRGKGWTGSGSGGALLIRDGGGGESEDIAKQSDGTEGLRASSRGGALRSWTMSGILWALSRPGLYGLPRSLPFLGLGETVYRPAGPPAAMDEATAALLLGSRPAADRMAELRRDAAEHYQAALESRRPIGAVQEIPSPRWGRGGWIRYPLRLAGGMEGFVDPARALRLGAAGGYPRALPHLEEVGPALAPGVAEQRWPGAAELVDRLVTLPTHGRTRPGERDELVELLPTGWRL